MMVAWVRRPCLFPHLLLLGSLGCAAAPVSRSRPICAAMGVWYPESATSASGGGVFAVDESCTGYVVPVQVRGPSQDWLNGNFEFGRGQLRWVSPNVWDITCYSDTPLRLRYEVVGTSEQMVVEDCGRESRYVRCPTPPDPDSPAYAYGCRWAEGLLRPTFSFPCREPRAGDPNLCEGRWD
jgi:hypothetical protein